MDKNSTQRLSLMGRRRFLETLSKIGVSAAALPYMTKETLGQLTDNPKDEVPRVFAHQHVNHEKVVNQEEPPKREPMMFTIPRDDWARIEGRLNAANRLNRKFGSEPWIGIGIGKPKKGSELVIDVRYTIWETVGGETLKPDISYEEFQERLPNRTSATVGEGIYKREINDIKVSSEKIQAKETASNYYNSKYRPIPAGCAHQAASWSCSGGTIAAPAYDAVDIGWVTCAHAVEWDTGVEIDQPNCTYPQCGVSIDSTEKGNGDAAFVKAYNDFGVSWDIADDSGGYEGWTIKGTMHRDGICDLIDNNDAIYMQGKATGRTETLIRFLDDPEEDPIMVGTYVETVSGDSGGPYYYVDDSGDAYMVGVHKGDSGAGGFGTAAFYVEDELNITI